MTACHRYVAWVLSVLAVLAAPQVAPTAAEPTTFGVSGGITGRVEWDSALNLVPRQCVRVRAFTQGPEGPVAVGAEGRIAADGTYAVRGLASGKHRLRFAQAADCEHRLVPVATQFYPDALEFTHAADIAVTEGEDIALTSPTRLGQASRVVGLVETSDGTRRGGVSVELYRRTAAGRWQAAAGTTTDDVGAYEWAGIPAGEYRVGYARGSRRFIPRFYVDSPTVAGARTLVLPPLDANQASVLLGRVELYEIGSEIVSRRAPRLVGKPVVGSRMRVVPGTWQEKGVTVRHQWQVFRSHKPGARWRSVPGATRRVFTARKKHLGHYVRIRVTATAPGYRRTQAYDVTRRPVRRR